VGVFILKHGVVGNE